MPATKDAEDVGILATESQGSGLGHCVGGGERKRDNLCLEYRNMRIIIFKKLLESDLFIHYLSILFYYAF